MSWETYFGKEFIGGETRDKQIKKAIIDYEQMMSDVFWQKPKIEKIDPMSYKDR